MLSMNVFNQDAFSPVQLSAAIDQMDYVPDLLDGMPGLFVPDPVRTEVIWIENRAFSPTILPFSPRGAPPHQQGGDQSKARSYQTLRYGDASRITSSELQFVRAFGSEVNLKDLQTEVARRQFKLRQDFAMTREYHKFNCVTGAVVKDSDGTQIWDWASEFSQTIPVELDFDLDNATPAEGAVRKKCVAVCRSIEIGLKGVGVARQIVGLCGNNFWDDLMSHPEIIKTYLNWQDAQQLRDHGATWRQYYYSGIQFMNYRGTDDATTLGVNTDQCKFFPVGAGIFRWAMSPGEQFAHLGQLGQDMYSMYVPDRDRDSWVDIEAYSYPLPVCTMPQALHRARRT